jgi:hypothetical protein
MGRLFTRSEAEVLLDHLKPRIEAVVAMFHVKPRDVRFEVYQRNNRLATTVSIEIDIVPREFVDG